MRQTTSSGPTNDQIAMMSYTVEHVAEDVTALRALLTRMCATIDGLPAEFRDNARRAIFGADAALADLDDQMAMARSVVQG